MIMNSDWIFKQCIENKMIMPFVGGQVRTVVATPENYMPFDKKIISYGLGGYGYDLRLSNKDFRIFNNTDGNIVDPKSFNPIVLHYTPLHKDETGEYFILPGHSYGLGVSLEHLNIPSDTIALFIGKSTYARCGLIVNMTPGENGWSGHLTIEISNSTPVAAKIYANEGICQALFFRGSASDIIYDITRKYQEQPESVVLPTV